VPGRRLGVNHRLLLIETMRLTSKPLRDQYVSKYTPSRWSLSTPAGRRIPLFFGAWLLLRSGGRAGPNHYRVDFSGARAKIKLESIRERILYRPFKEVLHV